MRISDWSSDVCSSDLSKYKTAELANNSVRSAQASFRSVDGTPCDLKNPVGACAEVADAFHPRIPRSGLVSHDRARPGPPASLPLKQTDPPTVAPDGTYSTFTEDLEAHVIEGLSRDRT